MKISYIVRKGVKTLCEDAALVGNTAAVSGYGEINVDFPFWLGAADGVGGNPGGAAASVFTVSGILEKNPKTAEELRDSLIEMNNSLVEYGRNLGLSKMASTFTGCYFADETNCFLAHIGNTRLWKINHGFLEQVTKDNTTYQMLLDMGDTEAAEHCNKSEITGCFGAGDSRGLISKLECGDAFEKGLPKVLLFTTDGIHDYLDIDSIENILNGDGTYIEKIKKLADAAFEAGSQDDMTVVLMENI